MKTKGLLLIALLFSVNLISQTKKIYHSNGKLSGIGEMVDNKKQGEWVLYHKNGKDVFAKGIYLNNKEDGLWEIFRNDQTIIQKGVFQNGKKEGKWLEGGVFGGENYKVVIYNNGKKIKKDQINEVYITGEKYSSGTLVNGKRDGEYKILFKNGTIKVEGNFNEGHPVGIWREYHENGNSSSIAKYSNGYLNGESISFFKDGSLKSKITYVDGQVEGYAIKYYAKNKLLLEGVLKDDEFVGKGVKYKYYDNGNIEYKREFKGEQFHGEAIFYYKNGNVKVSSHYVEDYKIGTYKKFFKDGTLEEFGENIGTDKNEKWRTYFENGQLKKLEYHYNGKRSGIAEFYKIKYGKHYLESKGSYFNGYQNGVWYTYESNGEIKSKITYKNGDRIKSIYATKLFFKNNTSKTVSIILRYRNTNENWVTEGWFDLKPGENAYLSKVLDAKFLYYGEGGDGIWKGDNNRKFKGKFYPMKERHIPAKALKYNDGKYTIELEGS